MVLGAEMVCPRCGAALEKSAYNGRIGFVCPERHGIAMTLGAVRALCGSRELVNLLWHKSGDPNSGGNAPCPVCGKPMSKVTLDVEGQPLELDICRRCQEVWFDPNELETLPPPPAVPEPEELPQAAREVLALEQIKNIRVRINDNRPCTNSVEAKARLFDFLTGNVGVEYDMGTIENPLQYLVAVLGLPFEADAPPLRRLPFVTWTLIFGCIAVGALTFPDLDMYVKEWGFIPAEFTRKGGATWVTSMFLHGGLVHLVGNMYFLWVFGDNVEDELGKLNYLGFILLSGFSATLLYLCLKSGSTIPCVGASGFIAGIIAMYAVLYPGVTIMIAFRRFFSYRMVAIPAWLVFVLWAFFQLVMAYLSYGSKNGGVAYAAHLGGAIPGLVCGFIMRYIRARRAEEFDL